MYFFLYVLFLIYTAADPDDLPAPQVVFSNSFQSLIEISNDKKSYSEELYEYFDGLREIVILRSSNPTRKTRTYSYFKHDELLTITGKIFFKNFLLIL